MEKTCLVCGNPFTVTHRRGRQLYCTPECRKVILRARRPSDAYYMERLAEKRTPAYRAEENERRRERYRDDAEHRNEVKLRVQLGHYGLTAEAYDALWTATGGRCAICRKAFDPSMDRQAHIDHDHETGRVRGLLCGTCNVGLGMFRDDAATIAAAARYLRRSSASPS